MMSYLEITSFIASILAVWLTIQKNKWCWFWNALSALLYSIYFAQIQLIADAILQYFFILVSIFGFYQWHEIKKSIETKLKYLNNRNRLAIGLFAICLTWIMGKTLEVYTLASLPYLDSFCFALSIIATILAIKKYIDNWPIWIFTNAIYIAMYIYKAAYLTAFLYGLFFVLAFKGWMTWKKQLAIN